MGNMSLDQSRLLSGPTVGVSGISATPIHYISEQTISGRRWTHYMNILYYNLTFKCCVLSEFQTIDPQISLCQLHVVTAVNQATCVWARHKAIAEEVLNLHPYLRYRGGQIRHVFCVCWKTNWSSVLSCAASKTPNLYQHKTSPLLGHSEANPVVDTALVN